MGLLRVKGMIDLQQFWPAGHSDSDTLKVAVEVQDTSFEFQRIPGEPFVATHAFDDARVGDKKVIRDGRLTIRLQGIDASELHYRPQIPARMRVTLAQRRRFQELSKNFRQYQAETSTVALATLLQQTDASPLACTITTAVDTPNEVFDAYARFIGTIFIDILGKEINVNRRLVEDGIVFPTLYSSISAQEIQELIDATYIARNLGKGLWNHYQSTPGRLDTSLLYREPSGEPDFDPGRDRGPVIFPKLFRRLSVYTILYQARIFFQSFKRYLEEEGDQCFLTQDFLQQGPTASPVYSLSNFISPEQEFDLLPEELVFQERPSELVDSSGNVINSW